MSTEPLLLLAGTSAVALAPRLSASGYTTVDWLSAGVTSSCGVAGDEPLAAVLGADQMDKVSPMGDTDIEVITESIQGHTPLVQAIYHLGANWGA